MRTIIAGSRSIIDYNLVKQAILNSGFDITEVVSGHAHGVDQLGEQWANENDIPIKLFKPDWDKFGKSAGFRRNVEMVEYAEALIACYDGVSKGTQHTINLANKRNLKVYVSKID